ncbi:MAG: hemerythrin domain-containing protein [Dehalococcoidia bacterium]|nr:hemerythrin domain-containing protein [Dehalococcoidia bacterium]
MFDNKRPTEILREEHRDVLQKLDALEKVFENLGNDRSVSIELKPLASFFNTDFWTHFAKEENALFPELEKFMPRDAGPVGVMLMEHDDLRETNAKMQEAIAAYLKDSNGLEASSAIKRYGTHFVVVLRDHINKEDSILFMMADEHLDGGQAARVIKLFGEIEAGSKKPKQRL